MDIERIRFALSLLPLVAFTADVHGKITWISDRWYAITGVSHDESLGEAWAHLVHPDDIETVVWRWTTSMENEAPMEATPRIRHADGSYHVYITRAERVVIDGSAVWIGTSTDLSAVPFETIAAYLPSSTVDENADEKTSPKRGSPW